MKKEYDFSKGKKVNSNKVDTDPKVMISLRLDPLVISRLKDEADSLGIGYQTLISSILSKHIDPKTESFEERMTKKILKNLEDAGVMSKKVKKKKSA